MKKPEYYVIFFYIFKSLAWPALQMETIIKKITQPKLPKTKNEVTKICNELGINWFQILSNINSAVLLYITLLQIHFEHKGENVPNFDWTWILVSNYFLCLIIGYCRIVLQRKCDHAMKLIIILYITSVQVGSWWRHWVSCWTSWSAVERPVNNTWKIYKKKIKWDFD